jgi:hypothetical protein
MSDAHFTFSTGEIMVFLAVAFTPPAVLVGVLSCATHWVFGLRWLHSGLVGFGTVATIVAALYTIGKLRGF